MHAWADAATGGGGISGRFQLKELHLSSFSKEVSYPVMTAGSACVSGHSFGTQNLFLHRVFSPLCLAMHLSSSLSV